jgi:alpha-beta hydrolase superfamily lysophospholipase
MLSDLTDALGPYVIFAKSAGILVVLKAIKNKLLNPKKCIFAGLPVYWADENNFNVRELISDYTIPTLFIQKTADPTISFNELKQFLKDVNVQNYQMKEVPGDTHHYENVTQLRDLINEFIFK